MIIAGLVFFAYYSLTFKQFKPFTVWVIVVALTSTGDVIGDFGATIPGNKCKYLVLFNLVTGMACLGLSVLSFMKATEH